MRTVLVVMVVLAVLLLGVHALTDKVVGGLHNVGRISVGHKTSTSASASPTKTVGGFPATSCSVVGRVTICRPQGAE